MAYLEMDLEWLVWYGLPGDGFDMVGLVWLTWRWISYGWFGMAYLEMDFEWLVWYGLPGDGFGMV